MGSWGCPHEVDDLCQRVNGAYCVPGMLGCILHGKVVFPDGQERRPRWPHGGQRATPGRRHAETAPADASLEPPDDESKLEQLP